MRRIRRKLKKNYIKRPQSKLFDNLIFRLANQNEEFSLSEDIIVGQLGGSYKELESNYVRGGGSRSQYRIENEEQVICNCTPIKGCGSECQNRQVYMECTIGCCPSLLGSLNTRCLNMAIQAKIFPSTEIFYTSECGLGLRLAPTQSVTAGTIIVEYLGEVISPVECEARMAQYTQADHFYFASLGNGLMLDAKAMGSKARFANHSCDPSCELQKWIVQGQPRIVLAAKKDLSGGSEITYNYQYFNDGMDSNYFGNGKRARPSFQRQVCRCRSKTCTGTIGGKVTTYEGEETIWLQRAESFLSCKKRVALDVIYAHIEAFEVITWPLESSEKSIFAPTSSISSDSTLQESTSRQEIVILNRLRDLTRLSQRWLDQYNQKVLQQNKKNPSSLHHSPEPTVASTSGHLNISELQSLLASAPRGVRIDEVIQVENLVKQAHNSSRSLSQLLAIVQPQTIRKVLCPSGVGEPETLRTEYLEPFCGIVAGTEEVDSTAFSISPGQLVHSGEQDSNWLEEVNAQNKIVGPSSPRPSLSSSPLNTITEKSSARIVWDDLLYVARELCRICPVYISEGETILRLYADVNRWAQKILKKLPLRPSEVSELQCTVGKNSAQWKTFRKLKDHYLNPGLLTGDEKNAIDWHDYVTCDLFVLAEYFEDRLGDFIDRRKRLKSKNVISSVEMKQCAGDRELSEHSMPQSNSIPTCEIKSSTSVIVEKLHCFCQWPETSGEMSLLAQCDACEVWYHTHCVNSFQHAASTFRKAGEFICPLCVHKRALPCAFTRAPVSEWRVPGRSKNIKGDDVKNKLKPSKLSSISSKRVNGGRLKPPLEVEDIELALNEELTLKVFGSPAALLLNLCKDYLKAWTDEVNSFLLSIDTTHFHLQLTSTIANKPSSFVPSVDHLTTTDPSTLHALTEGADLHVYNQQLQHEARQLSRGLYLYYELRVLGIKPPLVHTLRQEIWKLSARNITRGTKQLLVVLSQWSDRRQRNDANEYSSENRNSTLLNNCDLSSSVTYHSSLPRESIAVHHLSVKLQPPLQRFSLDDLSHALIGGVALKCNDSDVFTHIRDVNSGLNQFFEEVKACDLSNAHMYNNLLDAIQPYCHIERLYSYALVKSLIALQFKIHEGKVKISKQSLSVKEPDSDTIRASGIGNCDQNVIVIDPCHLSTVQENCQSLKPTDISRDADITSEVRKFYCWCRRDESFDDNMIECASCQEWYHFACVGCDRISTQTIKTQVSIADGYLNSAGANASVSPKIFLNDSEREVVEKFSCGAGLSESKKSNFLESDQKKCARRKPVNRNKRNVIDYSSVSYSCISCCFVTGVNYPHQWG